MFDAFLYRRPHIGQKIFVLGQVVMLADAPENGCALILLFSPGRPGRFFDMVSLSPAAVGLLDFLAPMIKRCRVLVVPASVKSVGDVRPISRPDVAIVRH